MNQRMILPRVSRDETTFAVIEFAGVERLDLKQAVQRAVTAWVEQTKSGQQAFDNASEDFNVGDLVDELGDPELQAELEAAGHHAPGHRRVLRRSADRLGIRRPACARTNSHSLAPHRRTRSPEIALASGQLLNSNQQTQRRGVCMPMKLSIGLSKKIGLPDYGSLGATCNLELELDQALIVDDLDGFHDRVRRTFVACRQAVEDELAHHRPTRRNGNSAASKSADAARSDAARGRDNGNGGENRTGRENGSSRNSDGRHASQKQLDYAQQLAGQIKGLGVRRLESLAQKMFSKPLADLSSLDASGLIDVLKDIKSGAIDLAAALNGAVQ